ncbi:fatty acid desaturase [Acuticoccus sp. I52.16.1]|uniref:fatty acid desaturase n=1 Tax=Acuticoccus sp. I52.16.1 TaxID=2928472 RepID=UPI001FD60D46|nr:fatty acid desaturase [Acuticoccus sp. I52.16.1]UOM35256.1 fatty acid desaturase [Acuticoccus sp. I52.16.1]
MPATPFDHVTFSHRRTVEWPTVALCGAVFGGWGALTYWHACLPLAVSIPAAAWVVAWHSSLQHEIVHGHPTAWRAVNRALGFVPLSLWIPFARYRAMHLAHHRDERLTDPLDDPETYYWTPDDWSALSPPIRLLVAAQATLLGRMAIGPAWCIGRYLAADFSAICAGDRALARVWLRHGVGCIAVLAWLWAVCGMAPWVYVALFVYPGTALLLVRSFAEHRAEDAVHHRTAIVERAPVLGLLFLYNNLHAAHHARPTLPWYRLPAWYAQNRDMLISRNGGLVYRGYAEIVRRYLLAPHDMPLHPTGRAPDGTASAAGAMRPAPGARAGGAAIHGAAVGAIAAPAAPER